MSQVLPTRKLFYQTMTLLTTVMIFNLAPRKNTIKARLCTLNNDCIALHNNLLLIFCSKFKSRQINELVFVGYEVDHRSSWFC